MKRNFKAKLKAATKSLTVWSGYAWAALYAAAETLQEYLPVIGEFVHGWKRVALAVGVATLLAVLRVRKVKGD